MAAAYVADEKGTKVDTEETLNLFSRDDDLYEALTYALACSKSAHESLHAFEIGQHHATCARTIEEFVNLVLDLLPRLTEMVDRVRDEGRSWTSLSLDEKDRMLRHAFEHSWPRRVKDFASVTTVWWEPFELVMYDIQPPASGCPAWVARWDRLRLEHQERAKTPRLFAGVDRASDVADGQGISRGTPPDPTAMPLTTQPDDTEVDWDGLMTEITRLNGFEDSDEKR